MVTMPMDRTGATRWVLAGGAAAVLAVPATLLATLLSVGACLGSEGAGVAASSARGAACDVPALGPWAWTLTVALLSVAVVVTVLVRRRPGPLGTTAAVLAPSVLVLTVPALLVLLPRG